MALFLAPLIPMATAAAGTVAKVGMAVAKTTATAGSRIATSIGRAAGKIASPISRVAGKAASPVSRGASQASGAASPVSALKSAFQSGRAAGQARSESGRMAKMAKKGAGRAREEGDGVLSRIGQAFNEGADQVQQDSHQGMTGRSRAQAAPEQQGERGDRGNDMTDDQEEPSRIVPKTTPERQEPSWDRTGSFSRGDAAGRSQSVSQSIRTAAKAAAASRPVREAPARQAQNSKSKSSAAMER